jgi:hypothetical protein
MPDDPVEIEAQSGSCGGCLNWALGAAFTALSLVCMLLFVAASGTCGEYDCDVGSWKPAGQLVSFLVWLVGSGALGLFWVASPATCPWRPPSSSLVSAVRRGHERGRPLHFVRMRAFRRPGRRPIARDLTGRRPCPRVRPGRVGFARGRAERVGEIVGMAARHRSRRSGGRSAAAAPGSSEPREPLMPRSAGRSLLGRLLSNLPYLGVVAFVVAMANFGWSFVESVTIGGALNGYVDQGHYYVLLKPGYHEVSQATWEWLRFHETSTYVTHALAFAGALWYMLTIGARRMVPAPRELPGSWRRVESVRSSGSCLAEARCGCRVANFSATWPFAHVSVHPGGLLLRVGFGDERAILLPEIRIVLTGRRWISLGLEIEHDAVDLPSPLILWVGRHSSVETALRDLAESEPGGARPS